MRKSIASDDGAADVDIYLEEVPEPARTTLKKVRAVIKSVVPAGTTEGISYGMPMFKNNGVLVGYAAFKKHCSLFPTSKAVVEKFKEELKAYNSFQGTIQFASDKPLPSALLKKIVKARLAEKELKEAVKRDRKRSH